MTHQEFDKRLGEAIDGLVSARVAAANTAADELEFASNAEIAVLANKLLDRYKREAKQAIKELFEEYRTTITGKEGGE